MPDGGAKPTPEWPKCPSCGQDYTGVYVSLLKCVRCTPRTWLVKS